MDKRIWAAGAGAMLGLAVLDHGITQHLVRVAVDRQAPRALTVRARDQFRGNPVNGEFLRAVDLAGQALRQGPSRPVTIKARDGVRLVGHWIPAREEQRIIIAMHGWRSSWAWDFGLISPFLRAQGCSVLYAEQRGQGISGGSAMGLGALERYDCLAWARWAAEMGKPVYLAGISMGATTVLMAAGLDLPEAVKGIVADCGFTSPEAIGRHIMDHNLHIPYGLRGGAADRLCRRRNRAGLRNCSAPEALKKSRVPVLLIHGSRDRFVPVEMSYENYLACAGPRELLIVPGADHGMSYYLEPRRYEQALKAFWEKYC